MPSMRSLIIQRMINDLKDTLIPEIPLNERRRRIDAIARRAIRVPRCATVTNISANGIPADWIVPNFYHPNRVVLYLHGGYYILFSPTTHRGLTGRIACAAEAQVLAIDYRLAPEHPFPSALEDAITAYKWLLSQGYESTNIAIGGDSAGGGLTLATATALRDQQQPMPGALFVLSPWTDLTFSGSSVRTRATRDPILNLEEGRQIAPLYHGNTAPTHPYISPVFADVKGFPPCFIQVGSEEILFDDAARMNEKMEKAGIVHWFETWEGMWHVFQAYAPYVPEAEEAIKRIGTFIKASQEN